MPAAENMNRAIQANLLLGNTLATFMRADEEAKSDPSEANLESRAAAWADVERLHADFDAALKAADVGPITPPNDPGDG
jgi:hypothetical protein